jgi:hypothetical protein
LVGETEPWSGTLGGKFNGDLKKTDYSLGFIWSKNNPNAVWSSFQEIVHKTETILQFLNDQSGLMRISAYTIYK